VTAVAPPIGTANVAVPAEIPAAQARSLHVWNARLAAIHALQAVVILAFSFAKSPIVTAPLVSGYLTFDAATKTLVPAQRAIGGLPIGPAVALFFLCSALAHFMVAYPARGYYERSLARGQNPARWVEYAFSSSIMIVVIATLSGIQEVGTLIAIFGANAAMILFGWSMEAANEGRASVQWLHYVFGCIAGAVPWVVIGGADPRVRDRHLRLAVHRLQCLLDQHGAAVPQGRALARLPLRRAQLHAAQPDREVTAGLAGLGGDAPALRSGADLSRPRRGGRVP